MPDDDHLQSLIKEAEEAANKPIAFKDLQSHERAMVRAIKRIGEQEDLKDDEIISRLKTVLHYLETRFRQKGKGSMT